MLRNVRSLRILGSTPHDDICRTCLGPEILLVHVVARDGLLEQARCTANHTADVAARITRNNAQQALASFLGQVGFLEHALGGVDVGQIECGAGVARVEDGG